MKEREEGTIICIPKCCLLSTLVLSSLNDLFNKYHQSSNFYIFFPGVLSGNTNTHTYTHTHTRTHTPAQNDKPEGWASSQGGRWLLSTSPGEAPRQRPRAADCIINLHHGGPCPPLWPEASRWR